MEHQKEALRRIISTLASKNEELHHFLESVDNTVAGLQEESCKVMSELEEELEKLSSALKERGAELGDIINKEKQRKEAELERQLLEGRFALLSCEELLEFANQTLSVTNEEEFFTAAKQIKERVTMAPAFRLTTRPMVSENMSQYTVDFSTERAGLQRLYFLPVPGSPEIDTSRCAVRDNAITVAWQPIGETAEDGGPIEHYELEYRKTNCDNLLRVRGACWEKICDIRNTQMAESRVRRERFAGESYTVLGDQDMNKGCYYWELRPLDDWKSLSVGVAYRGNLGRFDQLGKSAGSWCLFASQWLQSSLAAKHNNRAKALDWQLPRRIGIYCDYDHGDLLFVDVDRLCLLHSFKTKFVQPLVPAFTVWCGSITIATGLQVPSFMGTFLETHRTPSQ
uniref:Fibronectin type III and SPRY domain containing 1-like n=1 Tax=Nothobranchius pienaari TaxID=704102 RepID=A0A1A8LXH5_9TELE